MPIEKIGRYQIVAEVGKGAMGVVYKATDPNIGRTVALKTMRIDVLGVEPGELLRRFKNEARAAGVLNHPGIVTIYDAGEHEGMFYIAMEYIEGHTLQELLKRDKVLPVEQIADIVRQICIGLDYAHARGIVHRDIKPANIMIQPDGTAKIMDFGIAKHGGGGMTSTGQVVGTPNYMSPEAVRGRAVDGRSDLFGVGVILYEMLTGERPFTGESVTTVIYKIVNENPVAPRDLDAAVHPELSNVVMKALAKTPEQRYRTGAEFARDVQECALLASSTAGAAPPVPDKPTAAPLPATATASSAPTLIATITTASAAATTAPVAPPPSVTPPPPVTRSAPVTSSSDSTVSTPSRAAAKSPTPAAKKSGLLIGIAGSVLVVVLAIGLYVKSHRAHPPTPPPSPPAEAAAEQPAPAAPPQPAPEANSTSPEASDKASAAAEQPPETSAEPEPSKPVPAFGSLQITSTPANVGVTIDGRSDKTWRTPFAAPRLKAGRHSVAFALEGYQPESRQVEVLAGKKLQVDVTLQAMKAFVSVKSEPAGAQIFLDGHDSGQLTPSRISVAPGKHHIAVRKEGYQPQITETTVAAGEVFNFSPAMPIVPPPSPAVTAAPAPDNTQTAQQQQQQRSGNPFRKIGRFFKGGGDDGVLEVRTTPKGAEIWLGEKKAPSKSPAKLSVPPGNYTLSLRLAGHKPITRSITIEKGKMIGVDEIFEPQ